jgi:hypothetical protein
MAHLVLYLATVALLAAGVTPSPPPNRSVIVTPDQLKWQAFRENGWAPRSSVAVVAGNPRAPCDWIIRYRMPDGYAVPVHSNDDVEAATVLSGVFALGFGTTADHARAKPYPAGSYIVIDKRVAHYAWAVGDTTLEIRPVCRGK